MGWESVGASIVVQRMSNIEMRLIELSNLHSTYIPKALFSTQLVYLETHFTLSTN